MRKAAFIPAPVRLIEWPVLEDVFFATHCIKPRAVTDLVATAKNVPMDTCSTLDDHPAPSMEQKRKEQRSAAQLRLKRRRVAGFCITSVRHAPSISLPQSS
jgi:hypothetical protein